MTATLPAAAPMLTVSVADDARRPGDVEGVIASLPISLHEVFRGVDLDRAGNGDAGETADLVAVGGGLGWTRRAQAAIEAGARGVLVVEPVAEAVEGLRDLAGTVPVVIDRPLAGNPAVADAAAALAGLDAPHGLLETTYTVPVGGDLDLALLDQLALVAGAGWPVEQATVLLRSEHGYTVAGRLTGGRPVIMAAVCTDARAPSAWLRLLGEDSAVEVEVPSATSARAARVIVTTPSGSTLLPTRYETAHRAAWRRLHRLVVTSAPAPDLDLLAADLAVCDAADH